MKKIIEWIEKKIDNAYNIDNENLKNNLEKKGFNVFYVIKKLDNTYIVKFKNKKTKKVGISFVEKIGNKYFSLINIEKYKKNRDKDPDNEVIKNIISGLLGYKGFHLSESYCLKTPKSCILFPMLDWKMTMFKLSTIIPQEKQEYYHMETYVWALSTKGIKPIDLLILKKRNLVSEDLSNLILYRDKNDLEKQYGKEANNNILTNLSWYEILKAYTDPEVINASYIIGRERENSKWLGLTEKEIDFYANGGKYEVNIYVKVKKGGEIYKEKIKKGGYKEVKDLLNGEVLLEKKEKVELEEPIITKQQAQELKKLLLEGKKELSEKKEWLKISKAKIEKFKDGLEFA